MLKRSAYLSDNNMANMYKVTTSKNGGDAHALLLGRGNYAESQNTVAKAVFEHIKENPLNQPIAEVIIRWREPDGREYEYRIQPAP